MDVTFTSEERQLMVEVLEQRHRELLMEIARTAHHEFKNTLRSKETLLEAVIKKLRTGGPASYAA